MQDIKQRSNNCTNFLTSALLGPLTRLNWSVRDKDKQGDESKGHYSNPGREDCSWNQAIGRGNVEKRLDR